VDTIDQMVNKLWKNFRCRLHRYFVKNGGEENPTALKAQRHSGMEDQNVWEWLCDYWSTEEYKL